MYEKIKKWYLQGLWKKEQVRQAVEKGLLTESQFEKILAN
nr:XkdX family protein [uncultured Gemmiger sp.]